MIVIVKKMLFQAVYDDWDILYCKQHSDFF